jgi:putative phosphoribosyl transferase
LEIIPGATHLFSEPGALEEVIEHAAQWFERYLGAQST